MAQYHFFIEHSAPCTQPETVEIRSLTQAKLEAAHVLGELVRHEAELLWQEGGCRLTVKDESHLTLFDLIVVATDATTLVRG